MDAAGDGPVRREKEHVVTQLPQELADVLARVRPLDEAAVREARERQDRLTKPRGALGVLEDVSVRLAGLAGTCPPPVPEPAAVAVFAGDHGVHARGVSPWPQEVTAQMVANIAAGGAAVSVLARGAGVRVVVVVDVGVAADVPGGTATPGPADEPFAAGAAAGSGAVLLRRRVRAGTRDLSVEPALTRDEVVEALLVGARCAADLVAQGHGVLLTGDMGIANTTASAALVAVFTGRAVAEVTGRGTGIDDATFSLKVAVLERALALHRPDPTDPVGVLAAVGGLEHAALAGFVLAAAAERVPVVLDGVIAGSAALAAQAFAPAVVDACLAGHRSVEPGHAAALEHLGLRPLVDLDLRLGEGTGAVLALPLVQAAARVLREMATFDSAGVVDKADDASVGSPAGDGAVGDGAVSDRAARDGAAGG